MEARTVKKSGRPEIPKVIHYCWFGGKPLPKLAQKCIESWKKYFPDYEIKEWNESNFDVYINNYTKQAYDAQKYAFVSDFARFWILYREGGIYFDVDVEVIKSMDDLLLAGPFMGCERDGDNRVAHGLGAAATPRLAIYKELIDSYKDDNYIERDGAINPTTIVDRTTDILKKHGLKDIIGIQKVAELTIYPTEFFCPKSFDTGKIKITENTHSIHWYDASWLPWYKKMYQPIKHILPERIRTAIQKKTATSQLSKTKKSVGIFTFQHDNYGTRLQNYALSHTLESFDLIPVSIISKHPRERIIEFIRKTQSIVFPFGDKSARWQDARLKNRIFKPFVKKHIHPIQLSRKRLSHFGNSLHKAIAGSDQIWNPDHIERHPQDMRLYFLEFVQKEKRVAYAPSFGKKSVPQSLRQKYSKGIRGFNSLSVRENNGQKLVQELAGVEAEILPDPTFLLNPDEWHNLTNRYSSKYSKKSYIAVYFLSHQRKELLQSIDEYAQNNKLAIINIAGNTHEKGQAVPPPDEFLAIIQNASVVFTDSFHGVVFSIIFNRPFIVYDRVDRDQSSRIETLLKTYALTSAYRCTPDVWDRVIKQEDFSNVGNIMRIKREEGRNYLKKSLEIPVTDEDS